MAIVPLCPSMIFRTMESPDRPLSLVVKKGFEDSLQVFLADPATRVPHLDAKVLVVLVDLDVDGPSCFHGLRRIDENVQEGL